MKVESPLPGNILQFRALNNSLSPDKFHRLRYPTIASVYEAVTAPNAEIDQTRQNPENPYFSLPQVRRLIAESLHEMYALDTYAHEMPFILDPDRINSYRLVLVFSEPGTYFAPTKPEDNGKHDEPYTYNMDRFTADAGASAGIYIAGAQTGLDLSMFLGQRLLTQYNPTLNDLRASARQAIHESGLRFVYFGLPAEAAAIRRALKAHSAFVPEEAVDIIEGTDDANTLSQVRELKSYLQGQTSGRLLLVSYSCHMVRILKMIQQHHAIPSGMQLDVAPLPTPRSGWKVHPYKETKGIVYYVLTGNASLQSFPYTVVGNPTLG